MRDERPFALVTTEEGLTANERRAFDFARDVCEGHWYTLWISTEPLEQVYDDLNPAGGKILRRGKECFFILFDKGYIVTHLYDTREEAIRRARKELGL